MVENDLKLLELNLLKRKEFLDRLQEVYDKQLILLDSFTMNMNEFDAYMDKHEELLQVLVGLNEESEELYERLRHEELVVDGPYALQIERLKTLFSQIMAQGDSLQTKEQNCKEKLEIYFQKERKSFGAGRRSSKAALDYYKSMNRSNVISPQFMDRKK